MEEQDNKSVNNLDVKERSYATGRRKNSIARVWLKRGNGEIKVNGKSKVIDKDTKVLNLISNLKIPIKKVAIELNQKIVNKKKLTKIYLKKNDKIEIVHFIGGG